MHVAVGRHLLAELFHLLFHGIEKIADGFAAGFPEFFLAGPEQFVRGCFRLVFHLPECHVELFLHCLYRFFVGLVAGGDDAVLGLFSSFHGLFDSAGNIQDGFQTVAVSEQGRPRQRPREDDGQNDRGHGGYEDDQ